MRVLALLLLSGITLIMPSFLSPLRAQDRCGTEPYSKMLYAEPAENKLRFEQWMSGRRLQRRAPEGRRQLGPYQIPVVVHVIHNGESVGVGPNISDEQILSQLQVLNEDFNRENPDAVNTPSQFAAVAGSLDIEFVLARQDPNGLATGGIVRVNGGRPGWTLAENYTMKSLSYWPAEQYMNIWVCNLVDRYIGFAQHPVSDLPGMENSSTNRLTDGVVIWYQAFGSEDHGHFPLDPIFNKGRTTTHEVGHFLGLNHIWGDDTGCAGTDYVADTPNQGPATSGCPSHPRVDNCGEVVMFQNYLDYTNDACMNLFTQGQVDRMIVVLENSPRRNSLLTSPALLPPDPLPDDLGIQALVAPDENICSHDVTPLVTVRNHGENHVSQARIRFVLDGAVQETQDFPLDLSPGQSTAVAFSPLSLSPGPHDLAFQVLLTNGTTDNGPYNDQRSFHVVVPAFSDVPLTMNLEDDISDWIIDNPDGQVTWEVVPIPGQAPANRALKLNLYGYEDKLGEVDIFLSPVLDLSDAPAASLAFDVAHARYQASHDRLRVVALTNCQGVFDGTILYDKAGGELATAGAQTTAFTPLGPGHWRREVVDLTPYLGTERLQLAFVGINDWGNNIFLDNISLVTDEIIDVRLAALAHPAPVYCGGPVTPEIRVENAGTVPVTSLSVVYTVNGGAVQVHPVSGLTLSAGAATSITLPELSLEEDLNTLSVSLLQVNGVGDSHPSDNDRTFHLVVNDTQERIPLRETFEGPFQGTWTAVSPTGGLNWEPVLVGDGTALVYAAYTHSVIDEEAWLVSPVLDFSRVSSASVVFDLSQRQRSGLQERFSVMISRDCGLSFEELDFSPPPPVSFEAAWTPATEADWASNLVVNLSTLAGEKDARVAFVVRNQNANNVYLDNIEFFVTAEPDLIDIREQFAVYGYNPENMQSSMLRMSFNLDRRQDVRYSLINAAGQMETDGLLTDVLNQTYPLNLSRRLKPGVYFIRVQINNRFHTRKVLVF